LTDTRLRKWTLIAELISAVAVVVTLAILIAGMRENTNAIQAQTFQELMRDINRWRASIRELEEREILFDIEESGLTALSTGEVAMVRIVYLELWGIYESAYYANERGVLGPEEWTRFEYSICRERMSVSAVFFDQQLRGLPSYSDSLTPAFSSYVEENCS
jgi:hypothetical protein